jgi:Tfp pilus assembly protein PilE
MRIFCRGMTTIEVMIMMIATSLVIFASYGTKIAAFQGYHEIVNRERALLYAAETLEQFEAMKLTRMQQNYIESWDLFLGKVQGNFQLVASDNISDLNLVKLTDDYSVTDRDEMMVRYYDNEEDLDGFFTRLERKISIDEIPSEPKMKKVSVLVSWGEGLGKQVQLQALFSDHVGKGFAL